MNTRAQRGSHPGCGDGDARVPPCAAPTSSAPVRATMPCGILRAARHLPVNNDRGTANTNRLANVERWLHIWRLDNDTHMEISWSRLAGETDERNHKSQYGEDEDSPVAAFSSDARCAVVRSDHNRFRIWDLNSQSPLTPHIPLEGNMFSAEFSFSPPLPVPWFGRCSFEGRDPVAVVGVSGYGYKLLTRWSLALAPDQRPGEELVRLAQWLSGRRLDAGGALTELDTESWQALAAQIKEQWPSNSTA